MKQQTDYEKALTEQQIKVARFEREHTDEVNLKDLLSISARDTRRHRAQYWISFAAVFIVALCTLVVKTLLSNGPLIFLKMAESTIGQYDFLVFPGITKYDDTKNINKFQNKGSFIDFLKVMQIQKELPPADKMKIAPRKQLCKAQYASNDPISKRKKFKAEGTM